MFELVLSEGDLLKNAIPIVADILDEGVFKINKNGISLISPDRSMISVVDLRIPATVFEKIEVEGEKLVGVNMSNLVLITKRIKSGSRIILRLANEKTLEFIIEGRTGGRRKFSIPLIEVSTEKPPIEELTFKTKVEISSELLQEGIEDADIIDDSLVFEATPDKFKIYAKSETSANELEISKGEAGLKELNAPEITKARYPIDYLKKMIKARKFSDTAVIEFSTDYPLRLTFEEKDRIRMSFILAPRVEE